MKNQKGITLIALVITIIVLIILAGVAINLTLGENGILKRAENAQELSNKATVKEKVEVAIVEVQVEEASSTGRLTLQKLYETLESKDSNITLNEYTEGDTELTGTYNLNGKIYNFTIDSDFNVIIGDGEEDGAPEVEEPTVPTVKFGEITWTSGKASITLSIESTGTIEYQVNGTADGSWTEGTTVDNLNHEDKVYARINDGTTTTEPQQKEIKDTIKPEEFTISVSEDTITYEALTISSEGTTDNQTGLKDYSFVVTKDGTVVKEIKNQTVTEYPIEGLAAETEYVVYMLAYDNAGNQRKSNEITVTTSEIAVTRISGQYVNYGIDLNDNGSTKDDWMIFYKEEDETSPNYGATYIIPAYYVPISKMTTSLANIGMTHSSSSTYTVYWSSAPTTFIKRDNYEEVKTTFMYEFTGESKTNVYAVSRLLDTTAWESDFVTTQLKAKGGMAIGGPTLEIWKKSWDKLYPIETIEISATTNGYKVNGSQSAGLSNYTGYKTDAPNVYFPTKSSASDGTDEYWLASPNSSYVCLTTVRYTGGIDYDNNTTAREVGLRPVVYLPKEVTLEPSGTANVWNINYGE